MGVLSDELHYKLLKQIEANPELSQRELAKELGISLGRVNFCLKALIDKGLIKARNFKNSNNKWAYAYLLTPQGISEKARITARFWKRKEQEYESLKRELEELRSEVGRG